MGAYSELKGGLLAVDPRSIAETASVLLEAVKMQAAARGLSFLERRRLARRLLFPLKWAFDSSSPGEVLADHAAEQVSKNTINDWMDKLTLDMELVKDPLWQQAAQVHGIRQARGAIERGQTLAAAFPDLL